MAVYKVIQDIEAEDKLLGPLTLKGFVYAAITIFLGFLNYEFLIQSKLGIIRWVLILVFLPPMLLFAVLASPLGREQPTEVWLLSRIRFLIKSHLRLWSQSGLKELVTVTAPKTIEQHLTKELSAGEVKSRLKALANTMDSRGWAVKNVSVNDTRLLSYLEAENQNNSDRLVSASSVLQPQAVQDVTAADDILDANNNSKAREISDKLQANETVRKEKLVENLSTPVANEPEPTAGPIITTPAPTSVTPPAQTARLKELAQSGNALSIASVSTLANEGSLIRQIAPNEVEITLH